MMNILYKYFLISCLILLILPAFAKPNYPYTVIYTLNGGSRGLARIHDGQELTPPIYQNIVALEQKGFYKVKSNGKWGVISYDGKMIYPCKYGTFEINNIMKKYPNRNKYKDLNNYNYYYAKLLEGYYYLLTFGPNDRDTKKAYEEVLSADNKYPDLKNYAKKVVYENNINY